MQTGIQRAMFGKGSSTYRVPVKFFMDKHCKCMASLETLKPPYNSFASPSRSTTGSTVL